MLDMCLYRLRIGIFHQKIRIRKSKTSEFKENIPLFRGKTILQMLIRTFLILSILQKNYNYEGKILHHNFYGENVNLQNSYNNRGGILQQNWGSMDIQWGYRTYGWKLSANFQARYRFGNQNHGRRGIKNFHLNISVWIKKYSQAA